NGTYTFVTDHSGIGNAHIEPSTDAYQVAFLNDVLVRLTVSMSELADCETPITISDPIKTSDAPERVWDYYPNPSSGPLTIRFREANGTFYLADTQGKLLQRFAAADGMNLDLSSYPAGTYWLRHEDEEGALTQGQVLLLRR
ncbi:MAG: T9SS type A sorting domain-containing protein, partial [Bacteroidota bacterium]